LTGGKKRKETKRSQGKVGKKKGEEATSLCRHVDNHMRREWGRSGKRKTKKGGTRDGKFRVKMKERDRA